MCRAEDMNELVRERDNGNWDLDMRHIGKESSTIKNRILRLSRARLKLWTLRAITTLLVWTCIVQLVAIGDVWGPRLLKTFPSCSSPSTSKNESSVPSKAYSPPKRKYRSNGYLLVSCNGGLNQMRAAICDMVAIARYLNLTLLVPRLDKTSFWADPSDFQDIFDVDHFITSLRDEVRIVEELPPKLKQRFELARLHELSPISWSNISYYQKQVLPLIKKHKIVHFNRTDARLANNGLPLDIQKLRCKVNFHSLRFTPQIERLGHKVVRMLRRQGPFLVLHLRYEMDMLSFSGCTRGCNTEEVNDLTRMRYENRWWKEKEIDPVLRRKEGLCPLTPEEASLVLRALGFDRSMQIYIAAGEIYGGQRRLRALTEAFPNVVKKETLLESSDLQFFKNHSTQMAALDYLVSLESDVFIPTYDGNMAKVVEGHRRYLDFKKTIVLERRALMGLIDGYVDGRLRWDEFLYSVKALHAHRIGSPKRRATIQERPKEEDYFYANPQECLA